MIGFVSWTGKYLPVNKGLAVLGSEALLKSFAKSKLDGVALSRIVSRPGPDMPEPKKFCPRSTNPAAVLSPRTPLRPPRTSPGTVTKTLAFVISNDWPLINAVGAEASILRL